MPRAAEHRTDRDRQPSDSDVSIAQQITVCTFPTTEQVLSSLSVVLNGGGLSQLGEIVTEFNKSMGGRQEAFRSLVPKMNQLVGTLNGQRDNIIRAIEGLDRLTVTMNEQKPTIERALNRGPEILQLLVDQRPQLVDASAPSGGCRRRPTTSSKPTATTSVKPSRPWNRR